MERCCGVVPTLASLQRLRVLSMLVVTIVFRCSRLAMARCCGSIELIGHPLRVPHSQEPPHPHGRAQGPPLHPTPPPSLRTIEQWDAMEARSGLTHHAPIEELDASPEGEDERG